MRTIAATTSAPMTAMPPIVPPTIAPIGVDFLEGVDLGGISVVATGVNPATVRVDVAEVERRFIELELELCFGVLLTGVLLTGVLLIGVVFSTGPLVSLRSRT